MHTLNKSSSTVYQATTKFPEIESAISDTSEAIADTDLSPAERLATHPFSPAGNGAPKEQKWLPQKKDRPPWSNAIAIPGPRRGRQKSLSEAIWTIKERRASVAENAHEIAEALKAPVSPRLVLLCGIWYMTSIFSNASSKAILTAFRYPVTLTVVQFAFVSSWCIAASWLAHRFPALQTAVPALRYKIRQPSRELIMTTLPLTAFQIGGHILNSDAMARIPVSLVHTIKGLSPLFTVLAYRIIFRVHHSMATYLSLVPLTLGVVMACQSVYSSNTLGLVCAFGSALLFVTQNIVSKKLFNEAARAEADGLPDTKNPRKPDKLNLLCYSSGLAFILTSPLWLFSEGLGLFHDLFHHGGIELSSRPDRLDSGRLALEFVFNGTFHFAQSLVAFVLLSMVSPVTYSVASLIKRVFVVTFAIVWFGNPMSRMQAAGIAMTFVGLYLYDRTNDAARADRKARKLQARGEPSLLPLDKKAVKDGSLTKGLWAASPADAGHGLSPRSLWPQGNGAHMNPTSPGKAQSPSTTDYFTRRESDLSRKKGGSLNGAPPPGWLPPGTKQESTWMPHDVPAKANGVAT